ncbi:MAG TPA: glucodextranase DOMON-like domain-containing protein, partial [Thermoplasmata archaeon]|nr:glucodextranase DOMON-like domain-containing protein [Thermoplasmata archaeon]
MAILLGLTVLVATAPSARAQVGSKTITVDGDPSDWTGVNGAPDTGVVDAGEFVWNDTVNDDTGDGNYVYPTSGDFNDGVFDIQELRITADATNLYVLVKVVNLTNPWGGPDGFSTIAMVLLIDTTQDGSGKLTARPNVNIASGSGWEYFVKIGNTGWHAENAKVFDEAGNWSPIGNKASTSFEAVEAAIPLAFIGKDGYDIDGATWRFMFFLQSHAGENQDGFRDVNGTAEPYLFGGGLTNNNNDPKIQDIAFATSQAVQEAELSSYTSTTPATMASFADVTFDGAIGFTPDTTAPTISSVAVAPTFNQGVVTWTSDEIANT